MNKDINLREIKIWVCEIFTPPSDPASASPLSASLRARSKESVQKPTQSRGKEPRRVRGSPPQGLSLFARHHAIRDGSATLLRGATWQTGKHEAAFHNSAAKLTHTHTHKKTFSAWKRVFVLNERWVLIRCCRSLSNFLFWGGTEMKSCGKLPVYP